MHFWVACSRLMHNEEGDGLNENGPQRPIGSVTVRRYGLGVGVALMEELRH